MDYTAIDKSDIEKIKIQFKESNSYTCILPYTNRESDIILSAILKGILESLNQEKLHSHLEYALNELTMNASKANSKRLYFSSKGLDIQNNGEYERGIQSFKTEMMDNFTLFERHHREQEVFVRVQLSVTNEVFQIVVQNNSPMVEMEKKRIVERIQMAHKFEDLTDVLNHGFDTSEGGGFGLVIVVLMLRKLNLDEKALGFSNSTEQCTSTLKVPLNLLSKEQGAIVAQEIAEQIDKMPQFPQSIAMLQRELSDPNCSFDRVGQTINSDMTLTAEILRIANSPIYKTRNEISDVSTAVGIIGMLGVKSLLYNYGVNRVLKENYNKRIINEINDHSFKVALIAGLLARSKNMSSIAQDLYVAALLHDIGKIIVKSLHKDLEDNIDKLCREKHIPISILDDLTNGYNHALIGAKIIEKWDFPKKYINVIQYHHNPLDVDEEFKALTYGVYLCNEIYYYRLGDRDFHDINYFALQFFGMEREEDFNSFMQDISAEGIEL